MDQLANMYNVFSRVDKILSFIVNKMTPYIMAEGTKIVKNEENNKDPILFTTKLLAFKEQIDKMIEVAFKNDMKFEKARD